MKDNEISCCEIMLYIDILRDFLAGISMLEISLKYNITLEKTEKIIRISSEFLYKML